MKKNLHLLKRVFIGMVSLIAASPMVCAQTMNINAPYVQNFDSIGTTATATLPTGWRADKLVNAITVGTYSGAGTVTTQVGGNNMSSTASNGIYNFGAGDPSTATDRAIGGLSSSSASKSVNFYLKLTYLGSSPVDTLKISYDVEKYRGGTNSAGFSIKLNYSYDGSNWTQANNPFITSFSADATTAGYPTAPVQTVSISNQKLALATPLNANDTIYLAWNYSVTSGTTTSNAQALAIDNVSIEPLPAIATGKTGIKTSTMHAFSLNKQIIVEQANAPVTIYNIDGKKITQEMNPSKRLVLSVPQGLYIVKSGENSVKVAVH